MRVRFQDLPGETQARIQQVDRGGPPGPGAFFLRTRRVWLAWAGPLAAVAGALSLGVLSAGARGGDALLARAGLAGLAYAAVALLEGVRSLGAPLKPFILVTPSDLVRSPGSGRPLEMYRLAEASSFQRVEEYSGVRWRGQAFVFKFDGGRQVRFVLRRQADIQAALHTLDLARAAGRGEKLPGGPAPDLRPGHLQDLPGPGLPGQLLDPGSPFWIWVLLLFALGLIAWALIH